MLSRVINTENLHRSKEAASLSMYDNWSDAPDWIIGYWPEIQGKEDALNLYNHLRVWRERAIPNTLAWLWVDRSQADNIILLAKKQDFLVQPAPIGVDSPQILLQCSVPWGIRISEKRLVNPIVWAQEEIKRFCELYPADRATREFKEMLTTAYHDDYIYYLPERLDAIVRYILEVSQDQSAFFTFRNHPWELEHWRAIWTRVRDTTRSLSFWAGIAISPTDLAPGSDIESNQAILWYHYWWEQLVNPPQVIWSPWNFSAPAATAALERGAEYFSATWHSTPAKPRNEQ